MKGRVLKGFWISAVSAALALGAFASTATSARDTEIQAAVQKKLADKSQLRNVQSSVQDGVVTLSGTVAKYPDKEQAAKKAKVDHVSGVRNLVEVNAAPVSDADLQAKLAKDLTYDRADWGNVFNVLTVGVKDGIVTVGGEVRTPMDKDSALSLVANTKGVRDVIDNVKVAPLSSADDSLRFRLARAIYGGGDMWRYGMDPAAPIRILVDNGHVGLFGTVSSDVDRTMAFMRASSAFGAFSVENHLQVAGDRTR